MIKELIKNGECFFVGVATNKLVGCDNIGYDDAMVSKNYFVGLYKNQLKLNKWNYGRTGEYNGEVFYRDENKKDVYLYDLTLEDVKYFNSIKNDKFITPELDNTDNGTIYELKNNSFKEYYNNNKN